jgi:hypothetical protein
MELKETLEKLSIELHNDLYMYKNNCGYSDLEHKIESAKGNVKYLEDKKTEIENYINDKHNQIEAILKIIETL